MSTPKKQVVVEKPTSNGQETKKGAEIAAATLTPKADEKTEPEPPAKVEPVATVPEPKPSAEQILKKLPVLNQLKNKLESVLGRIDLFMSARARWTGECETLTINFGKREGKDEIIVITNATGVGKCLDMLITENERLAEKTKAEIESFTF